MLTDAYARRFSYLRLSVTEICNFRCSYCLPDGNDCDSRSGELTLSEIKHLVTAFARLGTRKVRITGGEPSLRKDLTEIIAICKAVPGIEKVALTTNGYRLKRDALAWQEAGLDAVNVSVDSLDADTFHLVTGQDKLADILEGIAHAKAIGIKQVKINTVLLKQHNALALPDFLKFVKQQDIALRFIELMRTGDNADFYQRQHLSGASIQQQLLDQGWQLNVKAKTDGPALEYSHADYQGRIGLIMPYSKDFCADCNRLRVSSLGQLYLCLFTDNHQELRSLLQTDNSAPLMRFLQQAVQGKAFSHQLAEDYSGSTRHLAQIGG
ncbi:MULTISPECIES: GTP 3',8-cyclase MoaA [unclassified Arsukibacterium]|uniref:GTP 3',8-cyclase MoaA n=1 Tax=unclassified Arsukibacterium TaxID=2635278 RepID=UPI000C9800D9|nr:MULTISPECIES: GTP 3',8-cyclase MoaA [unclassified Arsukibacterium]MAA94340.1 GTP 3',8-cyclase MoaA [Rheinheimera sp.]HAW91980.1 GTP 3',8-cyclase MoaA [Candidatus Azambacteria bacterium]|tara:strand:- start:247 stop:1218 length:972 start_codon:yes stop_codon:yes gene_type:complete